MNYYLIGIKGAGVGALACLLKDMGHEVSGSDIEKYVFTQDSLVAKGIPFYPFDKENIQAGMTVIVGNSFNADNNEEVRAALANPDVETVGYQEMLGRISKQFHTVGVCGTHGKTGTCGMMSSVLRQVKPTAYLIGDGEGDMPKDAYYFVMESCEYKRHFLDYYPEYVLLLNIDLDHIDYYKDMDDYENAFETFANKATKGVAVFGDEKATRRLDIQADHLYFGLGDDNDVQAKNVVEDQHGVHFDCYVHGTFFYHFELPLYGIHLLQNALGVISIAIMNGIDAKTIEQGILANPGVKRRFIIDEVAGSIFIDDYAHHHTAIKMTIAAAKQRFPDQKIVAIFMPDRFSRVEYFKDEYAECMKDADSIYFVDFPMPNLREPGVTVTIEDLKDAVPGSETIYDYDEGAQRLAKHAPCLYLFMSPKDIYKLSDKVKKILLKDFQNV